ncbi:hypothetical protein KM914_17525 [Virgibacillus pantothenticus]|uniref:Membrane protein n=3 Tax=Virgibacillus pantothenticus TaxID=1473 RepID=A0A0L0QUI6_VIRPA|nr:hypothetical protein [Virgibacillus pantothenticus]KNE22226.1 membrane protein [Virgibacillus pantothenticus]MBU8568192.1 hypothetical protein [Virgibacillus pantothenticus]MBU8601882.1 hypothetical protein [Virgibacillus pantothenticus]MBU8636025.1 hypothetical protein [Virgibacillus pantothenticus]MBU8644104.1 hypothetical protein [Virgibacillus pantothenticus]
MINFSLKILDLLQPLFRMLRMDYPMMRKILEVKLTMDGRRTPTVFASNVSNKRKYGNQFVKSLFIYVLYGLILIPFIFFGENYIFQISIIFGVSMFILMTSMVSDFSSVLLDVRDKTVLHTKPIHTRTISAAKIVHVAIYMSMLTGAFIGIPSIVMLGVQGISYFLLFLAEIVLLILFIMTITALVYIFILRFFSGEKLKDMINYVQILLSIGIVIGYQIVIRSFEMVDFNYVYDFSWWHIFIPPMWFGAPFELFLNGNTSYGMIILSSLAVIGPIISIGLYYKLMPAFERNLQKLMESTEKSKQKRRRIHTVLERLFCRSKEERQFFRFSSIIMAREREFKLKVYPTLGLSLIFPFIFHFNYLGENSFEQFSNSNMHFTIYFCNIMIGVVVMMLRYSSKYKGAWIFQTAPIENHSAIYSGTLKAFIIKLYLPLYTLLAVIFIFLFSARIIPDLVVVFMTGVLLTLISYKVVNNGKYPFSEAFESAQQGGTTMKTFLLMFAVGLFFLAHQFFSKIDFGVYMYLVSLMLATVISWRVVFKVK